MIMKTYNIPKLIRDTLTHLALPAALAVFAQFTAQAASITWNVAGGGDWDTSSPNWTGAATTFTSNGTDDVLFNNAAGGTINILSGMSPASTTVSGDYTFSGQPVAAGSLIKTGGGTLSLEVTPANFSSIAVQGGTLYLYAANHYEVDGALINVGTGDVTVESGAVIEGERAYLAGHLILNGGTWWEDNGFGGSWDGPITLAADSFFGRDGWCCNQAINGEISGPGGFTFSTQYGAVLTLNGTSSYTGKTIVKGGTLSFSVPLSDDGVSGPLGAPIGDNAVIDLYAGSRLLYNGPQHTTQHGTWSTNRALNLAGSSEGTVYLNGANINDTNFEFNGPITATGTGKRTLEIHSVGDRPEYIYAGGIPDTADNQVSVSLVWGSQSSSSDGKIYLNGTNTFTGPLALKGGNNGGPGTVLIGGSGKLGNGSYGGNITFTANPASVILDYASSAAQTLSGAISGPGTLQVTGSGALTLSGTNSYSGNTTINGSSSLVLGTTGSLTFAITESSSNKLTGAGSAALNGTFTIDTSGLSSAVAIGSWTLVDVASPTYSGSFSVAGFTKSGSIWTKIAGPSTWTFNQVSGVLSLTSAGAFTSFSGPPFSSVKIDNSAFTIELKVPHGTDLATIAPTFTVSSGTCNQPNGSVPTPSFAASNPVTYTITDGAIVNPYTVTVTVLPAGPGNVVSGLALWLDASVSDTMTLTGATVSEWRDALSNGAKATLGGGSPTLVASGIGGVPTVHFDSSSWMYDGVNHSSPVTLFYVSRQTGGSNARVLGGGNNNWLMGYWGGNRDCFYFADGWIKDPSTVSDTQPHFYATTIGGSGQNSTVYAEGVKLASNQNSTNGPDNLELNGYSNGGELSDCDISEVVVYDRILSIDELNAVGAYFGSKYGIPVAVITVPAPILVGPTGSGKLTFDAAPIVNQWSTLAVSGGSGDITADADLDSAMSGIDASSISGSLTTQGGSGTSATAYWRSDDQKLGTQPTGNAMTLLMATLKNSSGSTMGSLNVSYTMGLASVTPSELIKGHRVYWSKTGTVGTWTAVGDYLLTSPGTQNVSFDIPSLAWANGDLLYIVWADDNGTPNPDGDYTIDDVVFSKSVSGNSYSSWADTNAPGQSPSEDYDNDGVANGIEYFMGETGSSFTDLPGLGRTNTVTWKMNPAYSGTYQVQTSPDLSIWTDRTDDPTYVTNNVDSVVCHLPSGADKLFVRLVVTPN